MKVECSVSKNFAADLCRMSQVNGCKGRQVFQTCTRMFIEDWFLMVGTDWRALVRELRMWKRITASIRTYVFLSMLLFLNCNFR